MNKLYIEINGITKSLSELSIDNGLAYKTILNRYHKGDRGDDLIRPIGQLTSTTSKENNHKHEKTYNIISVSENEVKSKPTEQAIKETMRILKDFRISCVKIPDFDSLYQLLNWRKSKIQSVLN